FHRKESYMSSNRPSEWRLVNSLSRWTSGNSDKRHRRPRLRHSPKRTPNSSIRTTGKSIRRVRRPFGRVIPLRECGHFSTIPTSSVAPERVQLSRLPVSLLLQDKYSSRSSETQHSKTVSTLSLKSRRIWSRIWRSSLQSRTRVSSPNLEGRSVSKFQILIE